MALAALPHRIRHSIMLNALSVQHVLLTLSCVQEWEKRVSAGKGTSTEVMGHELHGSNDLGARQGIGGAQFSTRNRWNALT